MLFRSKLFVFSAAERAVWNQFITVMNENNENKEFWDRLALRMKEYSDEEIYSILQKHKLYEPPARKLAIEEAIRRGLIRSEQDLFSENFSTHSSGFTIFPSPDKPETVLKIVRSISRTILVAGVIPVIFGVLKFQVLKYVEGSSLVLVGLIWMTSAWMIFTRQDRKFLSPLLVIFLLSALYVARILFLLKGLQAMDYVIPSILFVVVFYILFYLRALLRKLTRV